MTHGIIYLVHNTVNNKCYIGQTINTLEYRWRQHSEKNSGCFALSAAIKKYGADKFTIEQIATAHSQEDLDLKEIEAIREYNTIYPNGYNLRHGGLGGACSDALKEKIKQTWKDPKLLARHSEIIKKVINTPEARANKSKGLVKHWEKMTDDRKKEVSANIKKGTTGIKKDMSWYTPEAAAKRSKAIKEAFLRPEVIKKRKAIAAEKWADQGYIEAQKEGMQKVKPKLSEKAKTRFANPEERAKAAERTKKRMQDPEVKARLAEAVRKKWQDPEFRAKMAKRDYSRKATRCQTQ